MVNEIPSHDLVKMEISFAQEMSKILSALRSDRKSSLTDYDRNEIINITDEYERYGVDESLLERAIRIRKSIA